MSFLFWVRLLVLYNKMAPKMDQLCSTICGTMFATKMPKTGPKNGPLKREILLGQFTTSKRNSMQHFGSRKVDHDLTSK